MIKLIVARGINGEIGMNNSLLWKLKGDMEFFRETTTGNGVIMGRNTFESIGKPLPNRLNFVITHNPEMYVHLETPKLTFISADTFREIITTIVPDYDFFIIGGSQIYKEFGDLAKVVYITDVEQSFPQADTFFEPLVGTWDNEIIKTGVENGIAYKITKSTRRGV